MVKRPLFIIYFKFDGYRREKTKKKIKGQTSEEKEKKRTPIGTPQKKRLDECFMAEILAF